MREFTDPLPVRLVVLALALAADVIWALVWYNADELRGKLYGRVLRGRAVVVLAFSLNVTAMSIALLALDLCAEVCVVWRSITRIHASLTALIIGYDILTIEGKGRLNG